MKILITGGCGYVGSRVALFLAGEGFSVIVTDKVKPEERGISFLPSVEFRQCDLRILDDAKRAVGGADLILHLAANIGPLAYMDKYQADIIQENLAIDSSLYPAMIQKGVGGIIYASSSMVFQHALKYPYKEEDIFQINPPTNIYGFSKLSGEYFCRAYKNQYNLPYTIIRYHNIYGPGEDSKGSDPGDIHVIPALIEKIINGQYPLRFLGDPTATRSFLYIDDAVDVTIKLIKLFLDGDKRVINNDFNIGSKEAIKILDLGKKIWDILGDGRPFKYEIDATSAITSHRREMDSRKIEEISGWSPKMSLKEGIKRTADWIKNRN